MRGAAELSKGKRTDYSRVRRRRRVFLGQRISGGLWMRWMRQERKAIASPAVTTTTPITSRALAN